MTNDEFINSFVPECIINYNKKYSSHLIVPTIVIDNQVCDYEAQFITNDLYNSINILHVSNELLNSNEEYIKQIIWHELTHLEDSLLFNDNTLDEYKNIMISYSEYHASIHEMNIRLETLKNNIMILEHEITLDSFMEQSLEFAIKDLKSNNTLHLYYLFGYYKALLDHNISYDLDILKTPIDLLYTVTKLKILVEDGNDTQENITSHYLEAIDNFRLNIFWNILQ